MTMTITFHSTNKKYIISKLINRPMPFSLKCVVIYLAQGTNIGKMGIIDIILKLNESYEILS